MRAGTQNNRPAAAGFWGKYRRGFLAAATVLGLFLALWGRLLPEAVKLEVGEEAPRTIVAPRTVWFVDPEKTEAERQKAMEAVGEVYEAAPEAADLAEQTVKEIFAAVGDVAAREDLQSQQQRLEALKQRLDVRLSDQTLQTALSATEGARKRMEDEALRIVRQVMRGQIRDTGDDLQRAREEAAKQAERVQMARRYRQAIAEIARVAIRPNRILDIEETNKRRREAAARVKPVRDIVRVGEIVVVKGQKVTPRHVAICQALGLMQPRIDWVRMLALLTLLAALAVSYTYFLESFAPRYCEDKFLALSALLALAAAVAYRLASKGALFEPLSLGATVVAVVTMAFLTQPLVAGVFGACASVLVGLMAAGGDARMMVATLLTSAAVAFAVHAQTIRTYIVPRVALVSAVAAAVFLALTSEVFGLLMPLTLAGYAAAAGFAGALAGAGLVMIVQRPLRITTDLWLMELNNPNEPILRRMMAEAPGTYQSSLMVAALAEAAAEAIGANALLVHTAALYHDIGKLKRPGFFIENQFGGENPHDRLRPQLSAMILAAHVRDGVAMAKKLGLPQEIIDAIAQHHGTTLMVPFYEKAKQQAEEGEEVPESLFRYPGPKPRTKENVILMLADSVEAAARSLDSYDPETIREMVERIMRSRMEDGQFDEAPITLAELAEIKKSLANTLVSMFHRRIPYPEQIEREMKAREQEKREQELEHIDRTAQRSASHEGGNNEAT